MTVIVELRHGVVECMTADEPGLQVITVDYDIGDTPAGGLDIVNGKPCVAEQYVASWDAQKVKSTQDQLDF